MNKIRFIAAIILVVLCVIIVLQNTEAVETKFLFFAITMPRAVWLLIATMVGFVLGVLVSIMLSKK